MQQTSLTIVGALTDLRIGGPNGSRFATPLKQSLF
jgi:hypothetical protein